MPGRGRCLDVSAAAQVALQPVVEPDARLRPSVVVVAEDIRASRRLAQALKAVGVAVVAAEASPERAVSVARRNGSEVIVLCCDLSRPGSMTRLRRIRKDVHGPRIVLVAMASQMARAREALSAGADALVAECDVETVLGHVVETVAAGQVSVPRELRRHVVRPAFSHRERQVLALMVEGLQNREIADRLYLAESTVKSHLASCFDKLGVRSRAKAAALMLDPDEGLQTFLFDGADAVASPEPA
jgi:DNA-binding NarL/FixJ family response regulator